MLPTCNSHTGNHRTSEDQQSFQTSIQNQNTQVTLALGTLLREASARELPCGVFGSFGWSGEVRCRAACIVE